MYKLGNEKGMTEEQIRYAADALKAIVGNHKITGNEWCEIQKGLERIQKVRIEIRSEKTSASLPIESDSVYETIKEMIDNREDFTVEYR